MKRISNNLIIIICLLSLVFIAFWPCLYHGFIDWDDYLLLVNNPLVISPHRLIDFFTTTIGKTYIPLTSLSFALEYHFFQLNPFIYHLDNILLHLIVVVLVYKICLQLGISLRASFLAAAVFAIHPMRVESVAWIAERKDVLYACFYLLAIYQYLKYLQAFKQSNYFLSLLFGLLSILSKPMALSLPLILFLLDWFSKRKLSAQTITEKLPFFAFTIFFSFITYSFFSPHGATHSIEAILIWAWTFMFYICKFIFPVSLFPIYQLPTPIVLTNPPYLYALIEFILFISSMIYFRQNRWWLFACWYYILSIFFLLHFNTTIVTMPVADRYMYLPSLGFCLMIGLVFDNLMKNNKTLSKILTCVISITLMGLVTKSFVQCSIWKNEFSFWSSLDREDSNYLTLFHLGDYYEKRKDYDHAIEYYSKALGKNHDFDFWIYQNIGITYLTQSNYQQALHSFDQSLILNPHSPEGYMLKASVYEGMNNHDLAFENYTQAIQYNPYFAQAYHNRAIIYCRLGQLDHAIDDLTHAIKIIPDFMTAYYLRGQVYGIQEEKNNALADFNTVLKIRSHYEDTERFISLLQNNKTFPHHLDIPNDTYDQPEWDPNGYSNYLPDKDRIYRL